MKYRATTIVLGGCLLAVPALAADLAKKAPAAANWVRVCDAYGAGYFYIPGSETCLKIGGFARAQYTGYSTDSSAGGVWGGHRNQHSIGTAAVGDLQIDARTQTELGLLRSFVEIEVATGTGASTSTVTLDKAFVQFGGLTAGRATSFFDFYTGSTLNVFWEGPVSDSNTNLFAYTFSFGNGLSATLSLEDSSTNGRRDNTAGLYGGIHSPDLVANLAVAQSWGKAQIMGALHDDYALTSVGPSRLGWAIGGGVEVNLPALGAKDVVDLQVAYGRGAIGYVSQSWASAATGTTRDFDVDAAGVHQASAWGINGGAKHWWTPKVNTALTAGWAKYAPGLSDAGFRQIDLAANVGWIPVTGLTVTAEVEYRNVDFTSPAYKDQSGLIGALRIERSF